VRRADLLELRALVSAAFDVREDREQLRAMVDTICRWDDARFLDQALDREPELLRRLQSELDQRQARRRVELLAASDDLDRALEQRRRELEADVDLEAECAA
jgi:hypothetical protein